MAKEKYLRLEMMRARFFSLQDKRAMILVHDHGL